MCAIGMSDRQLEKMIYSEAGTYAISGVIWGCVISIPIHWVVFVSLITNTSRANPDVYVTSDGGESFHESKVTLKELLEMEGQVFLLCHFGTGTYVQNSEHPEK